MDSDTTPAKRGRPRNSGKNDSAALLKVAEMLVANDSLQPWTVITKVVRAMPPDQHPNVQPASVIHRLNVKWRTAGPELLAKAAAQRDELEMEGRRQQTIEAIRQMVIFLGGAQAIVSRVALQVAPVIQAVNFGLGRWAAKPETVALFDALRQFQLSPEIQRALKAFSKLDPAVLAVAGRIGRARAGAQGPA